MTETGMETSIIWKAVLIHLKHPINMKNEYRYILDKSSKKFVCPECGKKRFVRFIDTTTGEYLPEIYGRCDKGDGHYFMNPYNDGYSRDVWSKENIGRTFIPRRMMAPVKRKPQPPAEPVYFDFETFKRTLNTDYYEENIFIQNLFNRVPYPFEPADVTRVIELYRLGTIPSGYRAGAVTFPFIDINGNVRAVQVKQFDKTNHTTGTDFLHSIISKYYKETGKDQPEWLDRYMSQDKKVSCLFGEHLLNEFPSNRIALVEAPKTAVYGTLYFGLPKTSDQYLWLAVYNKSSFSLDKVRPLQGRFVDVFPDLSKDGGTFREWEAKAKEFERQLPGTQFKMYDFLEHEALEADRVNGEDIADYLTKLDWRSFRSRKVKREAEVSQPKTNPVVSQPEALETVKADPVQVEADELERCFSRMKLPCTPVDITPYYTICEPDRYVRGAIRAIRSGKWDTRAHLERLQQLRGALLK